MPQANPALIDRLGALGLLALFVAVDAYALAAWFENPGAFGVDGAIYRAAAEAWLAGGDPWSVTRNGWYFAGPPPNLLLAVPFVPLGEEATRVSWMVGAFAASLWSVRRLGLPVWWVMFPPFWYSIIAGNPNPLVLALLLAGAGPAAVFVKVFAAVPLVLLGRWREVAWTGALLVVSFPLLPWEHFLARNVQRILVDQTMALSAWGTTLVVPVAVVILLLGKRGAWLAVPTLWPYSQIHYATLALPGCSRWVAAAMALPIPLAPVFGVAIAGIELRRNHARVLGRGRVERAPGEGQQDRRVHGPVHEVG